MGNWWAASIVSAWGRQSGMQRVVVERGDAVGLLRGDEPDQRGAAPRQRNDRAWSLSRMELGRDLAMVAAMLEDRGQLALDVEGGGPRRLRELTDPVCQTAPDALKPRPR